MIPRPPGRKITLSLPSDRGKEGGETAHFRTFSLSEAGSSSMRRGGRRKGFRFPGKKKKDQESVSFKFTGGRGGASDVDVFIRPRFVKENQATSAARRKRRE